MGKTYKKAYTSNLFENGNRNHHNSLLREFRPVNHRRNLVKDDRGLFESRDNCSDRHKRMRLIMNKIRRTYMKEWTRKYIEQVLFDE